MVRKAVRLNKLVSIKRIRVPQRSKKQIVVQLKRGCLTIKSQLGLFREGPGSKDERVSEYEDSTH